MFSPHGHLTGILRYLHIWKFSSFHDTGLDVEPVMNKDKLKQVIENLFLNNILKTITCRL
jgi:hypothetical protein